MKRDYELTVILSPKLPAEELKKTNKAIKTLVEKLGGKVKKTDDWGKKTLSYPIKKMNEGYYVFQLIELEGAKVTELEKTLELNESVLRYLTVKI